MTNYLILLIFLRLFVSEPIFPTIGICATIGDNILQDLSEWIDYHLYTGVDNFYLYYHGTQKSLASSILRPYTTRGIVKIKRIQYVKRNANLTCAPAMQCTALTNCVRKYRSDNDFMVLIDVDEFIYIRDKSTLKHFLGGYRNVSGLRLHWRNFGSSGHISRPPNVLDYYDKCINDEDRASTLHWSFPAGHAKTIANTRFIRDKVTCGPHACYNQPNEVNITYFDENMCSHCTEVSFSKIALNHYRIKSLDDFQSKVKTANSLGADMWNYFKYYNNEAIDNCTELVNFKYTRLVLS